MFRVHVITLSRELSKLDAWESVFNFRYALTNLLNLW